MSADRVREFSARWEKIPPEVRAALITVRAHEEEGAYNPTLLADAVRGFFRQSGGTEGVRAREVAYGRTLQGQMEQFDRALRELGRQIVAALGFARRR